MKKNFPSPLSIKKSNWLILSHAFNMDGRAASQTITDKIPHLIKRGIKPQILSSISGEKDKNFPHRQVLPWGASGLIFDLRFLLKRKIGRGLIYKLFFSFLNIVLLPFLFVEKVILRLPSQAFWALPIALIGIYRVKTRKVNLVYSTGGAWSAHLSGYWIWKITNVTWIVELHDPLINFFEFKSKSFESRILLWLERKISKHSSIVWWFTEEAESSARGRNIEIKEKGFNGLAGADPPLANVNYKRKSKLCFSHFGSLVVGRSLAPFLSGLNELVQSNTINKNEVELNIYGGHLDQESKNAIAKYNLQSIVNDYGRIEANGVESGRQIIMNIMTESDVLLIFHGEDEVCEEYIPSKFYEYLHAKRPILAYNYKNSQFKDLINKTNCYEISDSSLSSEVILEIYNHWKTKNLRIPTVVISTESLVEKIFFKLDELLKTKS